MHLGLLRRILLPVPLLLSKLSVFACLVRSISQSSHRVTTSQLVTSSADCCLRQVFHRCLGLLKPGLPSPTTSSMGFWVGLSAHVHAFLNNLKEPPELVAHRTKYYEFLIRAVLESLGILTNKLRFVTGSSYSAHTRVQPRQLQALLDRYLARRESGGHDFMYRSCLSALV